MVVLACCNLNAGTVCEHADDSKHVEYGSKFECVVPIEGTYNDNKKFAASAVIIKPKWILTAAHVVENQKEVRIHFKQKKFLMKKVIMHKDFKSNEFGYYDIALANSEENLDMDFYPALYENKDETGKIVSMCGWGLTGTFRTGVKTHDGKKRAGSNYVDYVEKTVLVCSPTRRGMKGHTSLEFLICSGDSGGGLFIDGKLAGINSCVMAVDKNPDSSYGDESCHTRISMMLDWIKENTAD